MTLERARLSLKGFPVLWMDDLSLECPALLIAASHLHLLCQQSQKLGLTHTMTLFEVSDGGSIKFAIIFH